MKYPISKEFFPYYYFTPPILTPKIAGWMGSLMRPPRWIHRDPEVRVDTYRPESYDGTKTECLVFSPRTLGEGAPCLVYYHGGGFFFGGAGHHYRQVRQYALQASCRVVFARYRLAPKHPHPAACEDSYAVLQWAFQNAGMLGIDPKRIAVGGDSAGGALAAAVCQMARDRGAERPLFQMLIYPVTDMQMQSQSQKQFTDTPMWNAKLTAKMWRSYVVQPDPATLAYASPMLAQTFSDLPPAYVETAQYDCLRDEAIAYAEAMKQAGVAVTLNQTQGTMHAFDIAHKAPTAQKAVALRLAFMKEYFYG